MPDFIARHSPSSLNLFSACPSMFVLERVLGRRLPVGAAAHRGTAVEAGILRGLQTGSEVEAIEVAQIEFSKAIRLNTDPRREKVEKGIPAMVRNGLHQLQPFGMPSSGQGFIEWRPEGLRYPIVGFYDFAWEEHGLLVDLKTTDALPLAIKPSHARQVALYASGKRANTRAAITYATPLKAATYELEDRAAHLNSLLRIAATVERFLALSSDPMELAGFVAPDLESFYWNSPVARQAAFEVWGI